MPDLGPAPTQPGKYGVVALFEEAPLFIGGPLCGERWNAAESSSYPVIARVKVKKEKKPKS